MIYLIDDKTNRQEDFGWNENKKNYYSGVLISISRYKEIEEIEERKKIFSDNNIILFHESFFDSIENKHGKDANEIRNNLIKNTKEKQNFKVIFFSGSYNSREINETGGSMPVSILYQNLAFFLNNFIKTETTELKFLFFGKNPEIESLLINKRETANSLLIEDLNNGQLNCKKNNLVISGNGQGFSAPFINSINQTIFNKNIVDDELNIKLQDWFSENEFDNIFIPLCFGPTLSDYNGLRLATHIRCTSTKNQLKPIFIYSFVNYSLLIENEYFDVLKTKNVFLIEYSKKGFQDALDINITPLKAEEISNEIKKINLQIPTNYEDNHSIANEWAIHRWSKIINANDNEGSIDKINGIQNSNLYFKYLKTIYPISISDTLDNDELKINFEGNPTVLYIDDEAEKGWKEIFETIIIDKNKIDLFHLDNDFNDKSKKEIIEISLKEIKNENVDLVILDFRLHKDDFGNGRIEEVTGYQILKKIKEYNKGIQVIIFSATNKIWNLQALQDAGADGFIVKEGPENSTNTQFTKQSILNFISITEECLNKRFLKSLFKTCEEIKKNINNTYAEPHSTFDNFKKELLVSLRIIEESANKIDLKLSSSLDVVFLNCYNFLEKFKLHYLKENRGSVILGFDEVEVKRYSYNGKLVDGGVFIRNNIYDSPSFFHCIISMLLDYFAIVNNVDITITKVYEIKEGRNDYIHDNKSSFDYSELIDIITICKTITTNLKD